MKKRYRCSRCGYAWSSEHSTYCLACHSNEIKRLWFFSGISLMRHRPKSISSSMKEKGPSVTDTLIDYWQAIKGFVFVILIFLLIFLWVYIFLMR